MIAIPLDNDGMPVKWSEIGADPNKYDFAIGWDDGTFMHGRPSALTFALDGRLFVANDNDGSIIWIAPVVMGEADAGVDAPDAPAEQ